MWLRLTVAALVGISLITGAARSGGHSGGGGQGGGSSEADAAGVTGTPTVQVFKDKARLHSVPGVKSKREYRALVESALGNGE